MLHVFGLTILSSAEGLTSVCALEFHEGRSPHNICNSCLCFIGFSRVRALSVDASAFFCGEWEGTMGTASLVVVDESPYGQGLTEFSHQSVLLNYVLNSFVVYKMLLQLILHTPEIFCTTGTHGRVSPGMVTRADPITKHALGITPRDFDP